MLVEIVETVLLIYFIQIIITVLYKQRLQFHPGRKTPSVKGYI